MANKDVHVSKTDGGDWKVKSSNAGHAAGYYPTKNEALDRAKEIATNKKSDVVTHDPNTGRINSKDSYGNDPHPPIDKEH